MLQTVDSVARSSVQGVKLQLLHVLKGTDLADLYAARPFPLPDLDAYCDLIVGLPGAASP